MCCGNYKMSLITKWWGTVGGAGAVAGLQLQFTEPWEILCSSVPIQHTEPWEIICISCENLTLEHTEEWES